MKIRFITLLLAILALGPLSMCANGQVTLAGAEGVWQAQFDNAWTNRDYDAMESLLTNALQTTTLRTVALATAPSFYVYGKPDYEKAQRASDELMAALVAALDTNALAAARVQTDLIKKTPKSAFVPFPKDTRDLLHREFSEFPIDWLAYGLLCRAEEQERQQTGSNNRSDGIVTKVPNHQP